MNDRSVTDKRDAHELQQLLQLFFGDRICRYVALQPIVLFTKNVVFFLQIILIKRAIPRVSKWAGDT
ncbi:unannotated protein [freshwater metagenome]|uniref:Unannotated protein n=1 Tax=freshwater metagenome TaxID=449393 RepID=A0A6J6K2B0_9ZZZZ